MGVVRGRARIVLDPGDARGLEPGDILVAPLTDPAWTPLFLFFFLVSALLYLASVQRLASRRGLALLGLGASALVYLVACLSKTAAITLPGALVVVDYAREALPGKVATGRSFTSPA